MTLKEKIVADMIAAMKARAPELETLRMLKADIMKYEVSGKDKEANDEVVMDILKRSIKQRKEAAEAFEKGGNNEAAEKEKFEIGVFKKYMPEQMDEAQVTAIIQEIIDKAGEGAQFGQIMGMSMGKLKNQADGALVKEVVNKLLK